MKKQWIASTLCICMLLSMIPAQHANAQQSNPKVKEVKDSGHYVASDFDGIDYDGAKAFDGDYSTRFAGKGSNISWLQVEFEDPITFQKVTAVEPTDLPQRTQTITISTSDDGQNWIEQKTAVDLHQNDTTEDSVILDKPVTTKFVKLDISGSGELNVVEVLFSQDIGLSAREKLGNLIQEAEKLDTRLYKVQIVQKFKSALSSAKTNYNNSGMADSQLNDTHKLLEEAMQAMDAGKLTGNHALNKTATADSVYDDMPQYNGQKAIDGSFDTRWASKSNKDTMHKFYLTIDLGKVQTFNQVLVFEHTEYAGRIHSLSVRVSNDGNTWQDWKISTEPGNIISSIVGDPVSSRYVQLEVEGYAGAGMNLDEVGIYLDPEAISTEPTTPMRPIDPNWHRPMPSTAPNVYQMRKSAMEYGLFLHYGVNTFNQVEWGNGKETPADYVPNVKTLDPDSWVRTAYESGMGYVVLITKHHDGFAMFDTKYSNHSVMSAPDPAARRDIVGEVAAACKKYGVKLGLYYSIWDMHWEQEHPESEFADHRAWDQAYTDFAYNQIEELMTNYGEIAELWIDGGWQKSTDRWEYERIYNMVKEHQPGCQMSVNLTLGYAKPSEITGGEEIINPSSDFRLYDGQDTAKSDTDPKIFTYKGESYYLPFEGTFRIGNGWFWNKKSSANTIERDADNIQELYTRYMKQGNTLVINIPPTDQGLLTDFETAEIYKTARQLGIAKGAARSAEDQSKNPCAVEVRYTTTDGRVAATTQCLYGKEGQTYTAPEPKQMQKLGYILTQTPDNVTGLFTSEKQVVNYVYTDIAPHMDAYLALAASVDEKISAIGEVTLESEAYIQAAREAYENLLPEQKALVQNLKILQEAESKLGTLKAAIDQQAADKIAEMIDRIGKVQYNEDCKTKIEAAREAYNQLTDAQKKLVSEEHINVLKAAESQYENLKALAEKPIPTTPTNPDKTNTPQTGDESHILAVCLVGLISLCGVFAMVCTQKKIKKSNNHAK